MTFRRTRRAALGAGLAALVAASSRDALAQTIPASNGAGLDTHLFRPAMDSKGLFTVNGSDIVGANEVSFGLVIDYGHELLRTVPGAGRVLVNGTDANLAAALAQGCWTPRESFALAPAQADWTARVEPDGTINFPYVGRIKAAGLTEDGLARIIERRLVELKIIAGP